MSDGEDKPAQPAKRRRRRRGAATSSQDAPTTSSEAKPPEGKQQEKSGDLPAKTGKRRRSSRSRKPRSENAKPRSEDAKPRSDDAKPTSGPENKRRRTRRKPDESRKGEHGATKAERPFRPTKQPAQSKRQAHPVAAQVDAPPSPPKEAAVRWGDDQDAPTPDIELKADLPGNPSPTDWDPTSAALLDQGAGYEGQLSARIVNVLGVRFTSGGRIYLYEGGDDHYQPGDLVVVESDKGQRVATVAAPSTRKPPPRSLRRILRRGTPADLSDAPEKQDTQEYLGTAKALAKELSLPIKVFRVHREDGGKKLAVYYSCDDKTDVRPLSRALSSALPVRVDLRHTGVRDEAKLVGGIGACGQELCCTTWLPSFVPVSIKHAKDQGLALTPSKISGQCGRLKCCLVYEQENYAKLRKGLPKLGKRVITNDGFEGRVIELDVLHQKIRVSVGRGESKVYMKGEVEPMFASQTQGSGRDKRTPKKRNSDASAEQAQTNAEQAQTNAEQAQTNAEQVDANAEQVDASAEQVEIHSEQAETEPGEDTKE